MISDFELLAGKINQLADLTYALRQENAELRLRNAELKLENQQLTERIEDACQRVSALIQVIPVVETEGEAAE